MTTEPNFSVAHARTLQRWRDPILEAAILAALQHDEQIPFCQEHRACFYHFYQSADFPKGVYRVSSAAMYRAGAPDWRIVFEVSDFDGIVGEDVYLEGVSHCVSAPERALLTLSVAGADVAYTLEYDLQRGALADEGFHFPAGKNHIAWRDEHSVWVAPAWDGALVAESGYAREVFLLRRGQNFSDAKKMFHGAQNDMLVHAWRYLDGQGAPLDLIEAAHGFHRRTYYQVMQDESVRELALPADAHIVGFIAGQLLVSLKSPWARRVVYPSGCLLAVKLNQGAPGEAVLLFAPEPGQALESVETTRAFVLIHYLDNVSGCLKAWRFTQGRWCEAATPQLPERTLDITDQPWGGDVVYIAANDFLTPLTLYALDLSLQELCVMRRQRPQFDIQGLNVNQFWATSADGARIPYWHVGAQGCLKPTWVYAYGGFEVAELPHYLNDIGAHWLTDGGAFVLANIRGGGEFGPAWHQAATGLNKQKSVDDLRAVTMDLAARGLAAPEQIGIQGGSNGGLICAALFAQTPECVGALVCEAPLIDMTGYTALGAGASWVDEYGDPDDAAFQAALRDLTPLTHLNAQQSYPPALITTRLSDDRVHPSHAFKLYERLRQLQEPVWLYCPDTGGHAGDGTQAEHAQELALIIRFLKETLGLAHKAA